MKRFLVLTYFSIFIFIVSAQKNGVSGVAYQPVTASVDSGIEHLKDYALILTECKDYSEVAATREFILKQGGSVAIIGSKNVMLGWVQPSIASRLVGQYGITGIKYQPVDVSSLKTMDRQTLQTVAFFNSVASGILGRQSTTEKKKPKMNYIDALPHPVISYNDYLRNLEKNQLNVQDLKNKNKLLRVKSDGTLLTGNSDKMVGTVTVALFMIESNGTIDPDLYTWNTADE